jgi:hypothetical protein
MVSEGNYPNIALFQVSEIVYSLSRNMAYGESQIDCRLNDEIAVIWCMYVPANSD